MEDLQALIDQYVQSESGAEISRNLLLNHGVVADMVINPETQTVAFQLLAAPEAMPYERLYSFNLKDHLHQKNKEKDRLALRSDAGVVYVLEPVHTAPAMHDFAFYQLAPDMKKEIRSSLEEFLGLNKAKLDVSGAK
jgi:hypothetical protein